MIIKMVQEIFTGEIIRMEMHQRLRKVLANLI